jgi:hypothetical protein
MNFEQWWAMRPMANETAMPLIRQAFKDEARAAWNAAIDASSSIVVTRFLGQGSPGGGISDLDDLDHNTQRMCCNAIETLKART